MIRDADPSIACTDDDNVALAGQFGCRSGFVKSMRFCSPERRRGVWNWETGWLWDVKGHCLFGFIWQMQIDTEK